MIQLDWYSISRRVIVRHFTSFEYFLINVLYVLLKFTSSKTELLNWPFSNFTSFRSYFSIKLNIYAYKLGCKRMQIGANGCGWVRMGALRHIAHKQHKNKAGGGNFWSSRTGFGSYGRGNFPGHDVCGCWPKWLRMGADGYWCIRMGVMGLIDTGRRKNKAKRVESEQAGHVFRGMFTCKNQVFRRVGWGGAERTKGGKFQ